jgi:hypothetical protein
MPATAPTPAAAIKLEIDGNGCAARSRHAETTVRRYNLLSPQSRQSVVDAGAHVGVTSAGVVPWPAFSGNERLHRDAVAEAVDRRGRVRSQWPDRHERRRAGRGDRREICTAAARNRARAFGAFLRTIVGPGGSFRPPTPHNDRRSMLILRYRRCDRVLDAVFLAAPTRLAPPQAQKRLRGRGSDRWRYAHVERHRRCGAAPPVESRFVLITVTDVGF